MLMFEEGLCAHTHTKGQELLFFRKGPSSSFERLPNKSNEKCAERFDFLLCCAAAFYVLQFCYLIFYTLFLFPDNLSPCFTAKPS